MLISDSYTQADNIPYGADSGVSFARLDIMNNEKKLKILEEGDTHEKLSILLDQYKLVANSYESILQRKIANNNVFVFIYSAIIGLYNFLSNENVPISKPQLSYSTYTVFIIGMIVGIMWVDVTINNIRSEKEKYALLRMFENYMPFRIFSKNVAKDKIEKMLPARYLDLILPLFMILVLALNFCIMLFTSVYSAGT